VNVAADTTLRAWEQMVADTLTVGVTRHHLANAGEHMLEYWLVDPGVVLQRIVVDAGEMRPSYVGPPESRHGGATTVGRR